MWTTATPGSTASASELSKTRGTSSTAAAARARSGSAPDIPTISAPASRAARRWTGPMKPTPAIAARSRSGILAPTYARPSALTRPVCSYSLETTRVAGGFGWILLVNRTKMARMREDSPKAPFSAGHIFQMIRERQTSRAEIARVTGLARSTVSQRIGALLELGIVIEEGDVRSTGGRPAAALRLNPAGGAALRRAPRGPPTRGPQ